MKLRFDGTVSDAGGLVLDRGTDWAQALRGYIGRRITITLGRRTKPRSDKQNAYYWGVVLQEIALYTGHDPDEVHEAMGLKFRLIGDPYFGASIRSTTSFSTVEMEDYLEHIRAWALVELDLTIPLPNEVVLHGDQEEEAA